jgi:uncharacterized protein
MIADTGLPEKTIQALQELFKKNPKILSATLYGSRAKGDFKTGSDIDLTLHAPSLTFSELLKLENDIDSLLLPYKVDLSLHHQIESADLLDHIRRVGKTFYQK